MEEKRRRVPTWKILLGLAAALALGAGAVVFWVQSVADRAWADMESRVAGLKAEFDRRPASRPVLRGEAVAGNAWDDYMAASRVFPRSQNHIPMLAFLDREKNADVGAVRAFITANHKALDLMRAGTRHAEVRPLFRKEWAFLSVDIQHGTVQSLMELGICKARLLREENRGREAMELLLDLGLFGRDLGQNTHPPTENLGLWPLDRVLEELAELAQSRALSMEEGHDLDRELAILDQSWPEPTSGMLNQAMALGSALMFEVKGETLVYGGPEKRFLRSWRWAFSSRLRAASTFSRIDRWCREALGAQRSTWSEEQRVCADLSDQVARWPEPIVRLTVGDSFKFPFHRRDCLSRLRVLRTAVHFQSTGEVLSLADSFGGQVRHDFREGRLKVWSVGRDGVDDGGSGAWRGGKDIVLEVER